jgi:hypothetical protein
MCGTFCRFQDLVRGRDGEATERLTEIRNSL